MKLLQSFDKDADDLDTMLNLLMQNAKLTRNSNPIFKNNPKHSVEVQAAYNVFVH